MNIPDLINDFYTHPDKTDMKGNLQPVKNTSLQFSESLALYKIIHTYKPKVTLEVGLALAGSAVAIVNAKKDCGIHEKHIVLDPFQEKYSKNAGMIELNRLGLNDRIELREEFSETYLSNAFDKGLGFDFIFIDGSHTIGQAVTDAFLSDKVLNPGGVIGVHDSLMFSTAASIKYLLNEKGYKVIGDRHLSIKTLGRQCKYSLSLGLDYCRRVIPYINTSITFIQKP